MSINELNQKIVQWADERNIFYHSTPEKQITKTIEEVGELLGAVLETHNVMFRQEGKFGASVSHEYHDRNDKVKDAMGDIMVTLAIIGDWYGITLEEALKHAYNEIKDREGVMANGVSVKAPMYPAGGEQ